MLDYEQKNIPPSFPELSKQIKRVYKKEAGPGVTINVVEVDEIADADSGKPAPLVVSYVEGACVRNTS